MELLRVEPDMFRNPPIKATNPRPGTETAELLRVEPQHVQKPAYQSHESPPGD